VYGRGAGRSKKEAEQQAAEAAWNRINNGEPPLAANGDTVSPAQAGQSNGTPLAGGAGTGGKPGTDGEPGAGPAS
jgi:hypothetical protein